MPVHHQTIVPSSTSTGRISRRDEEITPVIGGCAEERGRPLGLLSASAVGVRVA